MPTTNICLTTPSGVFNYRVGAIIQQDNKLMMVKNSGSDFYYTVGGRVQFGETTQEAIHREAKEELSIPLEIERLAFIHENFFTFEPEHVPCHELCYYFITKPHEGLNAVAKSFNEAYGEVTIHWLPMDKLDKFTLYPEFFRTHLQNPQPHIQHFVTRNDVTAGGIWQLSKLTQDETQTE